MILRNVVRCQCRARIPCLPNASLWAVRPPSQPRWISPLATKAFVDRRYSSSTASPPPLSEPASPPLTSSMRAVLTSYVRSARVFLADSSQRRTITSKFNFDTYKLVRQLERQGFTRGQAVAIMRAINAFLVDSSLSIRSNVLSKTDLENQTYLYKAHLQELRNELQLLRQNDSAQLKADTEQIMRDIESMNAKLSELLGTLKSDISMDLNNHKSEGRELGTDTDLRIQEIHHKLIVRISDLKTRIETMKVETTRFIVWIALGTFAILMSVDWLTPLVAPKKQAEPTNQQQPPPPIITAFPHPLRSQQPPPQPQQQQQPQPQVQQSAQGHQASPADKKKDEPVMSY